MNAFAPALNPSLEIEGVVLTMFDDRTNLAQQVTAELKRFFGDKVFATTIPRNVRLAEAPSHGKPVILYDDRSRGAESYVELAKEIIAKHMPDFEAFAEPAQVGIFRAARRRGREASRECSALAALARSQQTDHDGSEKLTFFKIYLAITNYIFGGSWPLSKNRSQQKNAGHWAADWIRCLPSGPRAVDGGRRRWSCRRQCQRPARVVELQARAEGDVVEQIPLDLIDENPYQTRTYVRSGGAEGTGRVDQSQRTSAADCGASGSEWPLRAGARRAPLPRFEAGREDNGLRNRSPTRR